jgi:hypothetical protein
VRPAWAAEQAEPVGREADAQPQQPALAAAVGGPASAGLAKRALPPAAVLVAYQPAASPALAELAAERASVKRRQVWGSPAARAGQRFCWFPERQASHQVRSAAPQPTARRRALRQGLAVLAARRLDWFPERQARLPVRWAARPQAQHFRGQALQRAQHPAL